MSDEHNTCAHITLLRDVEIHRSSSHFDKKESSVLAPHRLFRSIIIMVYKSSLPIPKTPQGHKPPIIKFLHVEPNLTYIPDPS